MRYHLGLVPLILCGLVLSVPADAKPRHHAKAAATPSSGPVTPAQAAPVQTVAPPAVAQKTIGVTLVNDVEKKVPIANATIFFAYYNPEKKEWQKSSQQSDSSGRAVFPVPGGAEGESYPFLAAASQDKLDKDIGEISALRLTIMRIPPAITVGDKKIGGQQSVELLIDGKTAFIAAGPIQIWDLRN